MLLNFNAEITSVKILSAEEIRLWDQYTILHEPIASIDLMERAAGKCVEWLEEQKFTGNRFSVFCGKGNNGGDGLAIARLLANKKYPVTVFILEFGHKGTTDFQANLARLHQYPETDIRFIQTEENVHAFIPGEIVIDALFGSGINNCFGERPRKTQQRKLQRRRQRRPRRRL